MIEKSSVDSPDAALDSKDNNEVTCTVLLKFFPILRVSCLIL